MFGGVLGRLAGVMAACAALLLLIAGPASAHSETVRSDPPNGGMVAEGQTTLTVWYDEGLGAAASSFQLRTVDGLEVPSTASFANGADKVVIRTEPLERGQYVIDWHALSLVDGHASSGTIVFGVGLRPDVVSSDGAGLSSPMLVIMRWIDLTALLLALGALAVGGRVLGAGGAGAERLTQRVRRWGVLSVWVAFYAGLLEPLLRLSGTASAPSAWLGQVWLTLTETGPGRLWLLREAALVVAGVALLRWHRRQGRDLLAPRIGLAALVVAVVVQSASGHSASLPVGSRVDALMAAGHVLAAGVWMGGLAVLALTIFPRRLTSGSVPVPRRAVWGAYSPRAAVASVVLLATGLYQAGHHLPDLGSLRSTVYGAALGGKVLLVLLALALAGVNTLIVNSAVAARVSSVTKGWLGSPRPDRLRGTVRAEVVVLGLAVALAAVLTSVPTAREIAVATKPASPQATNVDGMFLSFESVADGPSRDELILRLRSTVQPAPAPVVGVDVELDGPAGEVVRVPLEALDPTRFEAPTKALAAGAWHATVSVHRTGLPDTVMTADWTVATPAAQLANPVGRVTTTLAILLLVGLVLVLVLVRRRRPPPSDPHDDPAPDGAQPPVRVLVRSAP